MANGVTATGIRASAGSGKTYSLTTEYLRLLIDGAEPSSILATTFTRKAAAEILNRILERLAAAASSDKACAEMNGALKKDLTRDAYAAVLAGFCRKLQDVQVSTLDSLFGRLFGAYRHRLGWAIVPTPTDQRSSGGTELLAKAVEGLISQVGAGHDGDDAALLGQLDEFAGGRASRAVQGGLLDGLVGLLDALGQAPCKSWGVFTETPDAPCDVAAAVAALRRGQATGGQPLTKALNRATDLALADRWSTLGQDALICGAYLGKKKWGSTTLEPHIAEAALALAPRAVHAYTSELARRLVATHQLLSLFMVSLRVVQHETGQLFFSDVPVELKRALAAGSPGEHAYRLGSGWSHVMLDEFQDTSRDQWAILRDLLPRGDGGSVFWVGDPKQAIYSWRGGCTAAFEAIRHEMGDPEPRTLDVSYRSSQVILDAVNNVAGRLPDSLSTDDGERETLTQWALGYQAHEAANADLKGHVTIEHAEADSSDPGSDGDDPGDITAVPGDCFELTARKVCEMRTARPRASIGVLCRRNSDVNAAMAALRKAGVSCSAEGKSGLDNCPSVELILSALTLADHPGDSAAAYHLQSFPYLGVEPLATTQDRYAAAARIRKDLVRLGYAKQIRRWVDAMASHTDRHGATRLVQLVAMAEAYGAEADPRPSRFVAHVRSNDVQEAAKSPVRIMTLHAAKGLEFDVVYLLGMAGPLAGRGRSLVVARKSEEGEVGPVTAVYPAVAEKLRPAFPEVQEALDAASAQELTEQVNLLYVGMTRARHALHIVLPPPKPPTRTEGLHYTKSPARILVKTLAGGTIAGPRIYENGDPDWQLPEGKGKQAAAPEPMPILRFAAEAPASNRVWFRATPSQEEGGGKVKLDRLFSAVSEDARVKGLLLHGWFAAVEWSGSAGLNDDELRAIARREAPEATGEAYEAALKSFRAALRMPEVQAALARPAGEITLWREQSFSVMVAGDPTAGDQGKLAGGTFDRVVLHGAPGAWTSATILDFKSGTRSDKQVDYYSDQLKQYRVALSAMVGLPSSAITTQLLFTGDGSLVTVEA